MEIKTINGFLGEKNMSISDMARKLRITPAYMRKIANGKVKPGMRLAEDMEEAFEGILKFR
jgi:ribosome-binding protein aMBF1 (putative translation factor)